VAEGKHPLTGMVGVVTHHTDGCVGVCQIGRIGHGRHAQSGEKGCNKVLIHGECGGHYKKDRHFSCSGRGMPVTNCRSHGLLGGFRLYCRPLPRAPDS